MRRVHVGLVGIHGLPVLVEIEQARILDALVEVVVEYPPLGWSVESAPPAHRGEPAPYLLRAHVGDHRDELGAVLGWCRHFGGCGHESLL